MAQNEHINESILSDEVRQDMKKERIDHMTYLPGMEGFGLRHRPAGFGPHRRLRLQPLYRGRRPAALSGMKTALWRISARCSPPPPFRFWRKLHR